MKILRYLAAVTAVSLLFGLALWLWNPHMPATWYTRVAVWLLLWLGADINKAFLKRAK